MSLKFVNYFKSNNSKSINQYFRTKRFKLFAQLTAVLPLDRTLKILDIGGTQVFWERMNFTENKNVHITILNLKAVPVKYKNFVSIEGDATDLSQFRDKEFDIVFSNSVIEHLYSKENQIKMASEVKRVGKNYYVQTPNYYFPIEPHWLFPFFQFLPFNTRVFLTNTFTLGHFHKCNNKEAAINRVKGIRLLKKMEMRKLFPEAYLFKEVFLGLTKSFTMYSFVKD
jgi:ubiquinone/menaquinone biosynthesis C-methylase UbiE